MAKILFFTWDGGGNQLPVVEIGLELRRRQHQVLVAGFRTQLPRFRSVGLDFVVLGRSGDLTFSEAGWASTPAFFQLVMANPDHLSDVADLVAAERPDVAVVDCLLYGVLAAVEKAGIGRLSLIHTAPGAMTGTGPSSAARAARLVEMVNGLRGIAELPPTNSHLDVWGRAVVTSIRELDPAGFDPPSAFKYIGPVLERQRSWPLPWRGVARKPIALVSLSSTNAYGTQTSRLQSVLNALAELPLNVLVTAPSVDVGVLVVPPNAVVTGFAPHSAILPHAALAISHGGHGTLAAALASGVPTICMPNPMGDQPALAGRVEELGAGIALDSDASAATIKNAVVEVLGNSSYRDAARRLMQLIDTDANRRGADEIEAVASPHMTAPV